MQNFPATPLVGDAPDDLLASGHLWLLEWVDGAPLRFQLQESGLLHFGDRDRVYDDPGDVPAPYQHAVRHVRDRLDRDALRRAVDDVERVVFFGQATVHHAIDYDWERMPSFLGVDVWSAERESFHPPDAVEQIFEQLGLEPVNAVEREVNARDFDPERYDLPWSKWYDGPAAGVLIRNKRGQRAKLLHPDVETGDEPPVDGTAEELAARSATEGRFETLVTELEDAEAPVTPETLAERAFEAIVREEYSRLARRDSAVEMDAFRAAVAARARAFLDGRLEERGG